MIPSRVTLALVDIQISWMLMRSILSRLAKEKGHIESTSAVEHFFNETAMHARTQASNRLAKANRASHGPRMRAKVRVKINKGKSKGKSKGTKGAKGAKGSHKGKTSKTCLSGLETRNLRQARKLRNLHRHVPLTLPGAMVGIVKNGTMAGVLMNGMMTGVLLDGTKAGNRRMTLPQAHFHLKVWMSVPPVVRSGLYG